MKQEYKPMKGIARVAIMVAAFAISDQLPGSAQTATTTATTTVKKAPRTSATPEMIADAIERSKSRTERFKTLGIPEQFGSEDPTRFTVTK